MQLVLVRGSLLSLSVKTSGYIAVLNVVPPIDCVQTVEAVKLFEYLNESGVTPDQRSFESMIAAHIVNRDIPSASAVLAAMVSTI